MMKYLVRHATAPIALDGAWDGDCWGKFESLSIADARIEGSDHRPEVAAKLGYDAEGLYGLFQVRDRYVRCVVSTPQTEVSGDSCVEIFFQVAGNREYFDFEVTASGTPLVTWVTDPRIIDNQLAGFKSLTAEELEKIRIYHSLPSRIEPEITDTITWRVGFFFPFAVMANYGKFRMPAVGTQWRANLYKCGDATSHPHWLSWSPIPELNFHLPEAFGGLEFT